MVSRLLHGDSEGVAEPLCEVRDYRRDQLPPPWKGDGEVMSGLDRGA